MTNSIIAIKGNHLDSATDIFGAFSYVDLARDLNFDTLEDMYAYCFENEMSFSKQHITLHGIWVANGWTMIFDPETVNFFEDEALIAISERFNADVLTFVIQTTSGSFGFAKYNGTKLRGFFSSGGEVDENSGTPLTEEQGLNINSQVFTDDITGLAKKLGIDFENSGAQPALVKQLRANEELAQEPGDFDTTQHQESTKQTRPWWKFW